MDLAQAIKQDWNPYAPFIGQITSAVTLTKLNQWFGLQAPVWLKYNAVNKRELMAFLNAKFIDYVEHGENTIKSGTGNLEDAVIKGLCRIQDLGSQESLNKEMFEHSGLVWDACCGGGGKALLISDLNPDVTLYISDNRSQMVHNALLRFSAEGKKRPFSCTADLSGSIKSLNFDDKIKISKPVFDTVICDVPCSGSGTWRRSPEMLCAFSLNEIEEYTKRQRSIVSNSLPYLKPGGKLIYLTCSVFTAENESNSEYFERELGMKLFSDGYCGGYDKDADFIYRAVFEK
jgi:16S rRNA (cytosine967-C5)-methyltransferase